jgi:hypothetical protein
MNGWQERSTPLLQYSSIPVLLVCLVPFRGTQVHDSHQTSVILNEVKDLSIKTSDGCTFHIL